MENIALAIELFVVYFCVACWLFHEPSKAKVLPVLEETNARIDEEAIAPMPDPWHDPLKAYALAFSLEYEAEQEEKNTPDTQINIETIPIRAARKICGRLGIQQKVNGKDAPLSWLRAQIGKRLEESPAGVAPVILEVMGLAENPPEEMAIAAS